LSSQVDSSPSSSSHAVASPGFFPAFEHNDKGTKYCRTAEPKVETGIGKCRLTLPKEVKNRFEVRRSESVQKLKSAKHTGGRWEGGRGSQKEQ